MIQAVQNFRFGSRDRDDMMASLNICLLPTGNAASVANARRRTVSYTMVIGQQASANMAQLHELLLSAPIFAETIWESKRGFEDLSVLVDCLFRVTHPLSVALL